MRARPERCQTFVRPNFRTGAARPCRSPLADARKRAPPPAALLLLLLLRPLVPLSQAPVEAQGSELQSDGSPARKRPGGPVGLVAPRPKRRAAEARGWRNARAVFACECVCVGLGAYVVRSGSCSRSKSGPETVQVYRRFREFVRRQPTALGTGWD